MKVINLLTAIILLLLITSCSSLSFVNDSSQKITNSSPVSVNKNQFIYSVQTETLLWGIFPKNYSHSLKEGMKIAKFNKVGKLSTKVFQNRTQKLLTVLSLGVYIPETVEYTFWGEYFINE